MNPDEMKFIDSPEYVEHLLKHLARDPAVHAYCLQHSLTSDDLLSSAISGMQIYKTFGDVIFSVKPPVDASLMLSMLRQRLVDDRVAGTPWEDVVRLHTFIYTGELNSDSILKDLPSFIKKTRGRKVMEVYGDNTEHCIEELFKVRQGLESLRVTNKAKTFRPFAAPITKDTFDGVKTGFETLDGFLGYLNFGEYNLLIGYSGGGKTAMATNIATDVIREQHKKVLYFSIEEPGENVADRFYAQIFRIAYHKLHRRGMDGDKSEVQRDLREAFARMPAMATELGQNLVIDDVRDLAPVTTDVLRERLEMYAKTEGFLPDLVIADQMEFMSPLAREYDVDQQWQKQGAVSSDCDKFSEYRIQGRKQFAFLLLHQAKGKPKEEFTAEEIQGFKAIINPSDGTYGLGHKEAEGGRHGAAIKRDFRFFSLKSRHTAPFSIRFKADLEFMTMQEERPSAKGSGVPGPDIAEKPTANPHKEL